jgi:hypothetical protein
MLLGFPNKATAVLYNQQLIKDKGTLHNVTVCCTIRRPGGNKPGHPIAKISVNRLKLLCFWVRHQARTTHNIDRITSTDSNDLILMKEQKKLKDGWASDNKEPKYAPMTLNVSLVQKVFEKVNTLLTQVCGKTGIPLAYVIRHHLKSGKDEDKDPAFR